MHLRVTKTLQPAKMQSRYIVAYNGKRARGPLLDEALNEVGAAHWFRPVDGALTAGQQQEPQAFKVYVDVKII